MNDQTNMTDPVDSRFRFQFISGAWKHEKGFKDYLKKACGYPCHRAWADRLDSEWLSYCEDYARERGIRISNIAENTNGIIIIDFVEVDKPFGWS